jgi:hypothetical protein
MDKNVSLGLVVLSLMGIGLTFQMAEDAMNRDIEWMMEASLLDYVNPVAVLLCCAALFISLSSLVIQKKRAVLGRQSEEIQPN